MTNITGTVSTGTAATTFTGTTNDPVVAGTPFVGTITAAAPPPPVQTTIDIGTTTVGPTADSGNGNVLIAQPITLASAGALQSLSINVKTASGQLRLGLYSGSGTPTTLVAQTGAFTPTVGWNKQPLTSAQLAPGTYWLTSLTQTNNLVLTKAAAAAGATAFYKPNTTFGAMPTKFPSGPSTEASAWSFYGTFTTTPPAADTVAPGVPTGLNATATGSATSQLTWAAATDNVGVTGYNVYRNGAQVGTASTTSFADTGLVNNTAYTYNVAAFDAAGNTSAQSATLQYQHSYTSGGGGGGGTLPAGVTLQAIDGETMTSATVMSHNYYGRHGFTIAANPTFGAKSWDDPTFFPKGCFFGIYTNQLTDFLGLGLNTSIDVTGDTDMNLFMTNKIWGFSESQSGAPENSPVNAALCGMHLDEVDPQGLIGHVTGQDGRFYDLTATWNIFVFGGIGNATTAQVFTPGFYSGRSVDTFSADVYWFAGSSVPNIQGQGGQVAGGYGAPAYNPDQMARGSHYGNMIDVYRSWSNATNGGQSAGAAGKSGAPALIPLFSLIENGDGWFSESSRRTITGPELVWATWSSIIHGVRGLDYFTQAQSFVKNSQDVHDKAKATLALIDTLTPVINSPFAKGYLTDVTPHGYLFPVYESNWLNGGIEACVKWDGTNFYIIATTRNSQTVNNTSATFTLNGNVTSTLVTVINESRTIPITGGKFTDTFATASTVHIYKIS